MKRCATAVSGPKSPQRPLKKLPDLKLARLGAPRIPIPYAPPLEDTVRVTAKTIVDAVERLT